MRHTVSSFALLAGLASATPAIAGPIGPVEVAEDVTIDPILDVRIRYENVDQPTFPDPANAVTVRTRGGVEVKAKGFSFLGELESTFSIVDDFNDTIPGNGIEPFPVVADPSSVELNRLQVGYSGNGFGVTVGRQRIILDNARFVGNVGWRQNEQTFDAVRGTADIGIISLDGTYANSQRTIFGSESPNNNFDGDFVLLNGKVDLSPVKVTAYSYILDFDTRVAFSSQTFGGDIQGTIPLGDAKINFKAGYANQTDIGSNPTSFNADYIVGEVGGSIAGFGLKAGYEELGTDGGVASFQTPFATGHAFNGFADLFLVTPAAGLRDSYVTLSKNFKVSALPGLRAFVTYHEFDSDIGSLDYGTEVDAVIAFKLGQFGILAKYANYQADGFGVDTEKFWLQVGISF